MGLRKRRMRFTLSATRTSVMWAKLAEIAQDAWEDATCMHGAQVAELPFTPEGWKHEPLRLIVRRVPVTAAEVQATSPKARRRKTIPPEQLQMVLDGQLDSTYAYSFIVTDIPTSEKTTVEVEHYHRQRAQIECSADGVSRLGSRLDGRLLMDRLSVARVSGPLASWEEAYRLWLAAQGYSPFTVNDLVWQLDGLSRWVERERLAVGELTPERVEQFESARLAAGYSMRWARCTRLPLRFLREIGVAPVPAPVVVVDGPVDGLLGDYRGYLARERGLAESSIENYGRVARLFLSEREGVDGLALERLTAAEVSGFLARECPKRGVAGARDLVNGLRQLLRYLHVAGLISVPLRWAVPAVADLRDRSLPRGLDAATVAKLLAGCDRRRTARLRDLDSDGAVGAARRGGRRALPR